MKSDRRGNWAGSACDFPFQGGRLVEGGRAELEAEIVEDLFLGRYDPAKASRLDPRGRLRLVRLDGDVPCEP